MVGRGEAAPVLILRVTSRMVSPRVLSSPPIVKVRAGGGEGGLWSECGVRARRRALPCTGGVDLVGEVVPGMAHAARRGCMGRAGERCPRPVSSCRPVGLLAPLAAAAAAAPSVMVLLVVLPTAHAGLTERVLPPLLCLQWPKLRPLDCPC